jgi:membrane dipeptidase
MSENAPLLPSNNDNARSKPSPVGRKTAGTVLVVLLLIGSCIFVGIRGEKALLPKGNHKRANYFLDRSPVIDGHVDLPELARTMFSNDIEAFDLNKQTVMPSTCFRSKARLTILD